MENESLLESQRSHAEKRQEIKIDAIEKSEEKLETHHTNNEEKRRYLIQYQGVNKVNKHETEFEFAEKKNHHYPSRSLPLTIGVRVKYPIGALVIGYSRQWHTLPKASTVRKIDMCGGKGVKKEILLQKRSRNNENGANGINKVDLTPKVGQLTTDADDKSWSHKCTLNRTLPVMVGYPYRRQ
ncbi:hypothetical protein M9H77_16708 [Catharanthus roseus]|uniref:Uncharacterized protein n=1 Tax=Catharanthus roseus TaxID=4058 RepID=A0ACC0B2I6_CATRO|nr:hypothetical protein M9H77_16708 [Catharanthus roseus]